MMHSLVRWIGRRCLRWFYRERRFLGLERIPRDGPVLLIGNHGNDLPDVVCGLLATPRALRYVATISGATSAISQAAYRGLGVIPVMRVRDVRSMRAQGHDGAAMNNDAYRLVAESLSAGEIVGVFPEGGVHDSPSLGHFRAGVAQMALNSVDADPNIDVTVLAFGIQYDAPRTWRSDLSVVMGEPISLTQWLLDHSGDQAVDQAALQTGRAFDEATADGSTGSAPTDHAPTDHAPADHAPTPHANRARAKLAHRLRDRMHQALTEVTRNSPTWEIAELRDRLTAAVAGVLASQTDDVRAMSAQVQPVCAEIAAAVGDELAEESLQNSTQTTIGAAPTTTVASVRAVAAQVTQAVIRAGAMPSSPRDVARVLSAAGVRGGRPDWPSWLSTLSAAPLAAIGWMVHGPAFVAIWRSARLSARDRTEYVARAFVPGLYLILCAWALAGGLFAALLTVTSWSSWWAIPFVILLPRLGDVAVWWRDSVRSLRLRARVTRWSASDRAALCLAADALRVAWHSHLASTVVLPVVHPVGHPVAPELTRDVHAAVDQSVARVDSRVAVQTSSDARASS